MRCPEGELAIEGRFIAVVTAVTAACALVVGGIVYALTVPSDAGTAQNVIRAGHLALELNHGHDATLNFNNLAPGGQNSVDHFITADLGGVPQAALEVSLSSPDSGAFADHTSLTVYYSDPEPASDITWSPDSCTPSASYSSQLYYATLAELNSSQTISLGMLSSADDAICVRFELTFDADAGNDMQGRAADFSMNYTLAQTVAGTP